MAFPDDQGNVEQEKSRGFVVEGMGIGGKMLFATEVKIVDNGIKGVSVKADRRLDIGCEYSLKLIYQGKIIPLKAGVWWSSISGKREGLLGDAVPELQVRGS